MTDLPAVTVAIPTHNRAGLLQQSVASALEQDYPNLHVLVLDNASTDDTEAVVRSFADSRVTYVRNTTNIGLFRNWYRATVLNASPYLTILQDDDLMLPNFVAVSVRALEAHPSAGFAATNCGYIDLEGRSLVFDTSLYVTDPIPEGLIEGSDFLHHLIDGEKWLIQFSAVMLRATALAAVGSFDIPHSRFMLDLNLYTRMAAAHDLVFIDEELVKVRVHPDQDSRSAFRTPGGTGPLAGITERIDAAAYLLQSPRAQDPAYRRWLAERLLVLNQVRSNHAAEQIPSLNVNWDERREVLFDDLDALLPAGAWFIFVDDDTFVITEVAGRRAIPFLERDGVYWGPPPDSVTAIEELERLRTTGASHIVFGWSTFWWLDYYAALYEYLSEHYKCALRNSRLVAFDLRAYPSEGVWSASLRSVR